MSKNLAGFTITRSGEDYLITLEDDAGVSTEFVASYDQLDVIADAVEEQLDSDEEQALGVDEEDAK